MLLIDAEALANSAWPVLQLKLGQTVEYVKAFLNNKHGFPMSMVR